MFKQYYKGYVAWVYVGTFNGLHFIYPGTLWFFICKKLF